MSFQDIAKSVRAEADTRGLRATMSRLNDAIALACYGKKYAAVIAAEKAGKLDPLPSPPPHLSTAARRYGMDEHAFGLALRDGIEGRELAGNYGTVDLAMGWLLAQHKAELLRLEQAQLIGLADHTLVDRVLLDEQFASAAVHGFAEWVIAEGEMHVGGRTQNVSDLLLHGKSRPAWSARQRAYLMALAASQLRLYLIEDVVAGYHLTLRPLGEDPPRRVQVAERSGSRPELVGSMIGARVVAHNGRLELAGALYTFTTPAGHQLAEALRRTDGVAAVSRRIRSAWFEQFDLPPPKIVLAGTDEPLRLVTDTYRCASLPTLAARLMADPRVEGDVDLGWTLVVPRADSRAQLLCTVAPSEDLADHVTVFYESERRADIYREWFEGLAGDTVAFVGRESLDPYEAAMDPSLLEESPQQLHLPADAMRDLMARSYEALYADFADRPLPVFDGATPRQMVAQLGGEARVRELLATYESKERQMAQHDRRDPVDFDFLYRKLGLAPTPSPVDSRAPGLHPDQFAVNEAWIVFRLLDEPMETKDAGAVDMIGLMDAGSTCFLNFSARPAAADFSEIEARAFFQNLKVPTPPRPPRRVFIAADVAGDSLRVEAARRGIDVSTVEPRSLDGIVGRARESIGARLDAVSGLDR